MRISPPPARSAPAEPGGPRLHRREPLLLAGTLVAALVYAAYSILRHADLRSSSDLALYDQAVWHYSRFEEPRTTVLLRLPNVLGDHFDPILAALAPLYWLWSDVRMLLVAQALLVAAAAVPVFLYCLPRVGRPGAYALAVAYLLFWGVHSAVGFDFHNIAFAPLLIAALVVAADRERWPAFFLLLSPLLLVKEDLSVFVVFLGLYLLARRRWRQGAATVAIGLAWYGLVTRVLMPWAGAGAEYVHWSYDALGTGLGDALLNMARDPLLPVEVFYGDGGPRKLATIALLLVPFLGLVLLSPLAILTVPLLAERMLSSNPNLWGTGFHYSLMIAPILVMGAADGLRNLARLAGFDPRRVALAGAAAVIALNVAASAALSPLVALLDAGLYARSRAERASYDAMALIPPDASVAALNIFTPHLSHRDDLYALGRGRLLEPDYILVELSERTRPFYSSPLAFRNVRASVESKRPGYETLVERGGLLLLRRRGVDSRDASKISAVLGGRDGVGGGPPVRRLGILGAVVPDTAGLDCAGHDRDDLVRGVCLWAHDGDSLA